MRAIVFKKLIPITDKLGDDLAPPFLQTLRCHALLWEFGIQHGDISDTNLMVDPDNDTGILNDFDLATVADKDATDPPHGGDRTGTVVFMSLELLKGDGQQGRIPRLYRHDLESFCWVLFWICYCYDNGEFRPRYPCTEWINVTPAICRAMKNTIPQDIDTTTTTESYIDYQPSLAELVYYWVEFHNELGDMKANKSANTRGVDTGKPRRIDMSHVGVVKRVFEEPSDNQVLCTILDMLPQSDEVVMPWPQARGRLPTIYHSQLYAMYQLTLIKLMIYWVQFHNDMGFMKSRKSTMNMEGVDMREESDIDMSHLVDRVERTFEEPSDIEVLRNILDRLTLSMTVDM